MAILVLAGLAASQWRRIGVYQAHIERLATSDALTGLNNRPQFFACLAGELVRAKRYGRSFGFLMADIDGFKTINDRFGHPAGDRVLAELAGCLRAALRDCDVCGRVGGEEFAAFLPETDRAGMAALAERVCQAARTVPLPDGSSLSISVGGVIWQPGDESSEQVYARADAAMYSAKQAGKNRVTLA
jgi:diguanylate cyclase (GGDEF)-like protein